MYVPHVAASGCQKYYSLGRHSGSLLGRQHLSDATGMATSR